MFYYCTQYCNSVRMTCFIKRLPVLIFSYLLKSNIGKTARLKDKVTIAQEENT